MPKLEPKMIQKELESKKLRPFYWIYGTERMKIRELVKRIERVCLAGATRNDFNHERLEGSELTLESVLDNLQSFAFGGGTKCVVIQSADEIKNLDSFIDYFKQNSKKSAQTFDSAELDSVGVFVAKSFDARRKWSKALTENIAVVACEDATEAEREPWIEYLSKRRGLALLDSERVLLRGLDPWSLDIVDQEIMKLEMVKDSESLRTQVLLSGVDAHARDIFIDSIFTQNTAQAMKWAQHFGEDLDAMLPLLGLIAWNLRHLKQLLMEQASRSRTGEKRNPYLMKNLDRWKSHWTVSSIQAFEDELFEIDFSLKNTRLMGTGLWTSLILNRT